MDRTGGGGSRQRSTTSGSSRVSTRGSGLGLGGPVGNSGGYKGRPGLGDRGGGGGGCGCGCLPWILILGIVIGVIIGGGHGPKVLELYQALEQKVEDGSVQQGIDTGVGLIQEAVQGLGSGSGGGSGPGDTGHAATTSGSSPVKAAQSAKSLLTRSYSGGSLLPLSGGSGYLPGLDLASIASAVASGVTTGGSGSQGYADPESSAVDPSHLKWSRNKKGQQVLILTDEEWDAIDYVKLNVFVDTGDCFIDLGLDNLYEFDDDLNLIGEYDGTWLSLNKHVVAYYQLDGWHEGSQYWSRGYIPAFVNAEHANLVLQFDNAAPEGKILGVKPLPDTPGGELTPEQMCSGLVPLNAEDVIEPICDIYTYEGDFIDNYFLGEAFEAGEKPLIANIRLADGTVTSVAYRLTDNEGYHYWTPLIE